MNDLASKIHQQYENILNHKKDKHVTWAQNERFYAGDQWPSPTSATKDLPRPVFNVCQRILDHKVASVMQEKSKITFLAYDSDNNGEQAADIFTKYSEVLWEELNQDVLNEEILLNAGQTSVGYVHYYFDPSEKGGNNLKWQGKLKGEILDSVNVFEANQQQSDIQKQPYVIISQRLAVADVKKIAENNGVPKEKILLIQSDDKYNDEMYSEAQDEVKDEEKATLLTKYEKKNGKVFFTMVCSGVTIKEETATPLKLYPIAKMIWRIRKKSATGISEIEGLIPNQKSINFLMAMQLLSVQNMGWPKIIYNPNLLMVKPTNAPGQMIPSNSVDENVMRYLNPPQFGSAAANLVRDVLEFTKEMAGANENALGEQSSAQLNASAIMMLQKAASVPIESIKRRFNVYVEDVARIWEDILKGYYNVTRPIMLKDDKEQEQLLHYNFSEAEPFEFSLKIEVSATTGYSEALIQQTLDKLFDIGISTQGASGIDMKTYLKLVPKNVAPYKERLLQDLEQQEQERAAQEQVMMEQQMMMQQQQAEQMAQQPPTIEEETAQREQELKQRQMASKEEKQTETELSQDVQTIYDSVPQEIQMQIKAWQQQGISNREIINRLIEMGM